MPFQLLPGAGLGGGRHLRGRRHKVLEEGAEILRVHGLPLKLRHGLAVLVAAAGRHTGHVVRRGDYLRSDVGRVDGTSEGESRFSALTRRPAPKVNKFIDSFRAG